MNKQEEEINKVIELVTTLCRKTGLDQCHDFTKIKSLGDVIENLGITEKHLPHKGPAEKYMIALKEPKPSPTELSQPDMWKQLEKIIEDDLQDAIQSYDLRAAEKLFATFKNAGSIIEEGIDDIRMHLSEKRAEILAVVFEHLAGVDNIEWDENRVRIESYMPLCDDTLRELRDEIIEAYPEYYLERIMSEMRIPEYNKYIITWVWVG